MHVLSSRRLTGIKIFYKSYKEMGFELTMEELERAFAEKQEMTDDELDDVAGGWLKNHVKSLKQTDKRKIRSAYRSRESRQS